jgi:hypothetical protein
MQQHTSSSISCFSLYSLPTGRPCWSQKWRRCSSTSSWLRRMTPSNLQDSTVTVMPLPPTAGGVAAPVALAAGGAPLGLALLAKGVGEAAGEGGARRGVAVPLSWGLTGLSLPSTAATVTSGHVNHHQCLS